MATTITVDSAGRVLIPKPIRENLRLGPGDTLQVEEAGDQITLRPIRPSALLKKKRGLWVYQGAAASASIVDLIDREREKRLRDVSR